MNDSSFQLDDNSQLDKSFYIDGTNRMIDEGLEYASKILQHIANNQEQLDKLDRLEKKKAIVKDQEEFLTFSQIHPIVYEYLVDQQIFNPKAFKRYIKEAVGSPKTQEEQMLIAQDKRNVYYLKNKQYAIYYKYLLKENNKHLSKSKINEMYNDMVDELNNNVKNMLDKYEEAQKNMDIKNNQLTEEKRQELINVLKQRLADETNKN